MKNKKKTSGQTISKNQSKNDKHEGVSNMKKSPIKYKTTQNKSQALSSSQGSNFNYHPSKQSSLFYGKKYHFNEVNQKKVGDSNQSSTHCSINNRSHKQKSFQNRKNLKSKSLKSTKNLDFNHNEVQQEQDVDVRLNSMQVMQLINSYATKIQRQWRRYWFRKCLRFIVLKQRQRKQFQLLNQYYGKGNQNKKKSINNRISYNFQSQIPTAFQQQRRQNKRHTLPKLTSSRRKQQEEQEQSSESVVKYAVSSNQNQVTQQFFNNKKYDSISSLQSGKQVSNQDLSSKVKSSHQRTSSLGEKVDLGEMNQFKPVKMVQVGLNCSLNQSGIQSKYLNTPINGLKNSIENTDKKSSNIKSNIKLDTKVYQFKVNEEIQKPKDQKKINQIKNSEQTIEKRSFTNQLKKSQKSDKNFKSYESINSKYDTKFPSSADIQKDPFGMTKIFKKCKKAIKKQVDKKLSKLQKNYEQKQITERTYKNLIKQTKQKLTNEIKTLEIKEGNFKNTWKQVYVMFKDYVKQNSFQHTQSNKNDSQEINFQQGVNDHSISLDKWDFQSSAKKSISHLQSFQDFAKQLNQRNPDKIKGYFFENKKISSDHKTIQKVLDELDRLQNLSSFEGRKEVSKFKDQDELSILEQFKKRQRSNSFQKKNDQILVQNISEKTQYAEIKSPNISPGLSPKSQDKRINKQLKFIPFEQVNLQQSKKYSQAKRQVYEFPDICTPTKSVQNLNKEQAVNENLNVPPKKNEQKLKTDESQEDSLVQMKITSIKVENHTINVPLYVPQNAFENKSSQVSKDLQAKMKLEQQQLNKINQQKIANSRKLLLKFGEQYFALKIVPLFSNLIKLAGNVVTQVYRQKKRRKELQQAELKRYPPTIDASIDAINTWLLQISHHLLDHHNLQIKKNLINIKQVPKQQMLEICHSQAQSKTFYQTHSYITISQKIFKEFEFFYLKNVANNMQIEEKHQQNFQHLLYAFHRCLIDCMNLTLLDELIVGRNWVMIPWINSFRYKKNEVFEHTKQCLQRAINKVSGWAEYSLAQLTENTEINQTDWKQYQEEKMNLVIREQVLQFSFDNQFMLSNLLLKIYAQIYNDQMALATKQILSVFNKQQ